MSKAPLPCTARWSGSPTRLNAYTVNQNGYTRIITYSACPSGGTGAACAADPLLQVVVGFDDEPPGTVAPSIHPTKCTPIADNGSCGDSMTQLSWQWNSVVPVVSSISPLSGPVTGGTTIQINGAGFISGETVNLIQESGGAPVNPINENGYNPPVSATVVSSPPPTCALPTCIEAISPIVLSAGSYFVTVTTPGGTSAFSAIFTYNAVTPFVAGLVGSVTGGSVTGGNTVTIEGTGFWATSAAPAQVFFCPTGGGSCVASPSNTTNGVVISLPQGTSPYETITAQSPAVGPSGVGTYYVQVEVNNLFSQLPNVAVFTYSELVPIITGVTPQTPVAQGGSITITGFNFVTGVYVGFCQQTTTSPYYNQNCVNAGGNAGGLQPTAVTPVSTNQIVVTVPNLGGASGTVYYPIVALGLPPYAPQNQPGDPYNEPADEFTFS